MPVPAAAPLVPRVTLMLTIPGVTLAATALGSRVAPDEPLPPLPPLPPPPVPVPVDGLLATLEPSGALSLVSRATATPDPMPTTKIAARVPAKTRRPRRRGSTGGCCHCQPPGA